MGELNLIFIGYRDVRADKASEVTGVVIVENGAVDIRQAGDVDPVDDGCQKRMCCR